MATEAQRYIDPDAIGLGNGLTPENAYTSSAAWDAGEGRNLITSDEWMHAFRRSNSATADTSVLSILGWTTNAEHYIQMDSFDNNEAVKEGWDNTRYRLSITGASLAMQIREDFVRINELQAELTSVINDSSSVIKILSITASNDIRISNCRLRLPQAPAKTANCIQVNDPDANVSIWNCILNGKKTGGVPNSANAAIRILNCTTANIYNCILESADFAYTITGGTINIYNNVFYDIVDSSYISGSTNIVDYVASDIAIGTNHVLPKDGDWLKEFINPANDDWTPLTTGNLNKAGADDPSNNGLTYPDSSGFDNSGVLSGTLGPNVVPGISGNALDFNTGGGLDNRINFGNGAPLDQLGNGDFSISLWLKSFDTVALNYGSLFAKWISTGNWIILDSNNTPNTLRFLMNKSGVSLIQTFTAPVFDTNWNNIIVTVNRTTDLAHIYINNSIAPESMDLSTLPADASNTDDLTFGARDTGVFPYEGSLDELKVFDHVLSVSERADIVNDPGGTIGNEIGQWHLDESIGLYTTDMAGNPYNSGGYSIGVIEPSGGTVHQLSASIVSRSHVSGNLSVPITETLFFRIDTVESINYDIDNLESLDFRMNTIESINYNIDIE